MQRLILASFVVFVGCATARPRPPSMSSAPSVQVPSPSDVDLVIRLSYHPRDPALEFVRMVLNTTLLPPVRCAIQESLPPQSECLFRVPRRATFFRFGFVNADQSREHFCDFTPQQIEVRREDQVLVVRRYEAGESCGYAADWTPDYDLPGSPARIVEISYTGVSSDAHPVIADQALEPLSCVTGASLPSMDACRYVMNDVLPSITFSFTRGAAPSADAPALGCNAVHGLHVRLMGVEFPVEFEDANGSCRYRVAFQRHAN